MDQEARHAAARALTALARSHDYRDRADAGHGLAAFAELPDAAETLRALVLDPDDTFVTLRTTAALLRRGDGTGVAVVAAALPDADWSHQEWIHAGATDALGLFADDLNAAVRHCAELPPDADGRTTRGAALLRELLGEIEHVLGPAHDTPWNAPWNTPAAPPG
ncbi:MULTISPECIES: hypothetical protein [Kitasatospora]|uniref:HEAT repeat domain-containing protein n=1 Tax=Kitasatospora setae (strain ATCC 33774 / DSM 43861 / JCM 3304 / KCC A-0304 / NBRC 14216 / KM-6054) TaxID=452652 RepID=E4NJS5_KITSK|nr:MULTISPECIES: hypothetical protein [Kitasatospora]BAJ33223.1 hypothetical protein KSE_74680 [Kitasatospora setae KM-6054]